MPDTQVLAIEKMLAIAHQSIWRAAHLAESMRDQGLSDDLHDLANEVNRITEDLLRSGRARKLGSPPVRI